MKLIRPSRQQATVIVQAMRAVLTAEGRIPLLAIEDETIGAIQRHLMGLPEVLAVQGNTLPENLSTVITDQDMRQTTVRILALLPVIDQKVLSEKVFVVETAARSLDVQDQAIIILRDAVRRRHKRMAMSMMARSVAHYWSPTGKVRMRDWLDMVRITMPSIPGIYSMLTDKQLLRKYRAMGGMPSDTVANALYRFYRKRGFPLPGEPRSFPEGWGKHEVYHLLSEYDTTLYGEMLTAAFSGGNTEKLCMDLLLATLLQFHAGRSILPGPVPTGLLHPDTFFRAVSRGATMNVDLLDGWDLWTIVERSLPEVRSAFQIPPLSEHERSALIEMEALIAA